MNGADGTTLPPLRGPALISASLRTVLFALIAWLFLALFTLALPLLPALRLRQRYAILTYWSRITLWWLRVICRLDYRVSGQERIPTGSAIVISNHQSAWETLAFQSIFPPHVWVLKRALLRIPLFGWCLAMLRPIAIDRGGRSKALRQVIDQGRERLADGMWVVVFPEGTRMPPGALGSFNPGGAMLAERAGVPALPVAHDGGTYWPRGGFLIRPGTVHVAVGPPIDTARCKAKEINRQAEAWIRETLPTLGTHRVDGETEHGDG